jgi:hypothetical protein
MTRTVLAILAALTLLVALGGTPAQIESVRKACVAACTTTSCVSACNAAAR